MDASEFDDFKKEITTNGYKVSDFQINNTDLTKWNTMGLSKIQGKATIKYKSSRKEKSYITGSGTSWVVDFSEDLKAGYFNIK